mmetsp:Transcript_20809/g.31336  ORF Transcript_20809/g.31336 Transcript_20809/m.31336 type:complete len:278 (-) Transcript_20809:32-865(-)
METPATTPIITIIPIAMIRSRRCFFFVASSSIRTCPITVCLIISRLISSLISSLSDIDIFFESSSTNLASTVYVCSVGAASPLSSSFASSGTLIGALSSISESLPLLRVEIRKAPGWLCRERMEEAWLLLCEDICKEPDCWPLALREDAIRDALASRNLFVFCETLVLWELVLFEFDLCFLDTELSSDTRFVDDLVVLVVVLGDLMGDTDLALFLDTSGDGWSIMYSSSLVFVRFFLSSSSLLMVSVVSCESSLWLTASFISFESFSLSLIIYVEYA